MDENEIAAGVRLIDVANRVGVSEATVSRALNNKPGVSDATRKAILSALDVIGYQRPERLRNRKHRLVGLVLSDITDPFYSVLAHALGEHLAEAGMAALLCSVQGTGTDEKDYIDLLLAQEVSGVIFGGGSYQEGLDGSVYAPLIEHQLPVVLLNAVGPDLPFAKIVCDDYAAAQLAWQHLVQLGHTKIGLIAGRPGHQPSARKIQRLLELATRDSIDFDETWIRESDYTTESGRTAASSLIDDGATGIICISDNLGLGAILAAESAGLSVPGDVSVIGYDDSPFMTFSRPSLTTVRQPVARMAKAMVSSLAAQIEGQKVTTKEQLFQPELVARNSTGVAPR